MPKDIALFSVERAAMERTPLQRAFDNLSADIANAGASFVPASVTRSVFNQESYNPAEAADAKARILDVVQAFATNLESVHSSSMMNTETEEEYLAKHIFDLSGNIVSKQSVFNTEAAVMASVCAGDPQLFHKQVTARAPAEQGVTTINGILEGSAGSIGWLPKANLESYDTSRLNNFVSMTIAFNGGGARQDSWGELFFDTKVTPLDQTGHEVVIRPTMIMGDVKHNTNGDVTDFGRRRLLDAVADPSILANRAMDLVPYRDSDPAGTSRYFFTDNGVAVPDVTVDNVTVPTGFLRTGEEMDLLTLTAPPGLLDSGVLDHTDQLDVPITVGELLLEVPAADNSSFEYIRISSKYFKGAMFQFPAEGEGRDQVLNMDISSLPLRGLVKLLDNSNSTLLQALDTNGWEIQLTGLLSGKVNLNTSRTLVNETNLRIARVFDVATSQELSKTDPAIAAFLATLGRIRVVGWTPDGTRSNLNLRERGLILTYQEFRYRFAPVFKSPISVVIPTSKTGADAAELEALTSAARVRNSNEAVLTMFNYDAMFQNMLTSNNGFADMKMPGADILTPYYNRRELDVYDVVKSMHTHERELDINAVLINAIRDEIHLAMYRSGMYAALEHTSLGGNVQPIACIGTDPITLRHLTIKGDPRTAGIMMETQVAATTNKLLRQKSGTTVVPDDEGTIFITFKRPGVAGAGIDPLSFGFFSWSTELVSVNPIGRNGQTSRELTVQPRCQHFVVCPILIRLDVKNLRRAAAYKP